MTDPTRRVIPGLFFTADVLAARDARIRAEIAEDIAQAIESHHAADNLTAIQSARIARYHATQYDDLAAAASSVPTGTRERCSCCQRAVSPLDDDGRCVHCGPNRVRSHTDESPCNLGIPTNGDARDAQD